MRGVNIHADFVMIQCMKNKNLTPLSHPLCHPAIRRGSNNVYSGPGVPPFGLPCLGVGRMPEDGTAGLAYAASPYGEALKFRSHTPVFALRASPRQAPSAR